MEALRRADTDAPAKLYDAYGERLYDYAWTLIGDRESAADAVHDALVTAQGCVERLRDNGRLRPWLYALTRFQATARLAHRSGGGDAAPPVLDAPEDPELAELVRQTLGELRRNEREVLELSVRHGLTPGEAGAVLGLTSRQAASRLGRARDQLENAAAAVVLARTGRAHCPDLSAMLDSWQGPLTPLLRRRLSGHISGCEVCTEGRHQRVAAGRLLDMVPVDFPPLSLRRRVIDTCVNPERDQTRTLITDRGDSFDRTGFPVAVERRSRRRRPRRLAPVVLAGVCVVAATAAMALVNDRDSAESALRAVPAPSTPEADPTGPSPEPVLETDAEPSPEPTPTTTPTTTTTPKSTARNAPSARPAIKVSTTRPAAVPTATRRQAAPGARLATSCPAGIDGVAKVGLRARNATVTWNAASTQGLDVFPASGSIKAGGSVAIWVTVDDPGSAGSGRVSFNSNAGSASCSLSWQGDQPPTSEPPTDPATPTPHPSESTTEPASITSTRTEALDN
ncbi:sigma-70 family RNA polymerase sigma factor [Nonomuraea sp. NPDC005983]|uniref:RNA polymerase sigma factor n=1 Tax=Nonomuraea sp. NPDC005983 TaxID=3155595 RepID=UPI0033A62CB9